MSRQHDGAGVALKRFQSIITQRTAELKEKTREKLYSDLKRIKERKSTEGDHPFEVFPNEVWRTLMNKLNPEERAHLWNLHESFHEVKDEASHVQDDVIPQILRSLASFIPSSAFAALRSVSRSMRDALDRHLEEELLKASRFGYTAKTPLTMLQHLKVHPRPISIAFDINMDLIPVGGVEQIKAAVAPAFEHGGKNVWFWTFRVVGGRVARANIEHQLYFLLIECLHFMPNLKGLKIAFECERELRNINVRDVLRRPFPRLEKMERLDFDVGNPYSEMILGGILAANPQITSLHLFKVENFLPSVKSLHLESFSFKGCSLHPFKGLGNAAWNGRLKQLRLDIHDEFININVVFKLLERYPSLERLSLILKRARIGTGIPFLSLPSLMEFDLTINPEVFLTTPFQFFFSLQFLLFSKNLRNLKHNSGLFSNIKDIKRRMKRDHEGLIDFRGGWEDLSNANVWKVFPSLEHVTTSVIDVDVEKRGYLRHVREYRKRVLVSDKVFPCAAE